LKLGITSTVVSEAIYAVGHTPVDLNNILVSRPDRDELLHKAEADGFPAAICTWIKGIYSLVLSTSPDAVVVLISGDCSNTLALAELLTERKIKTIPFGYPNRPDPNLMAVEINRFADALGASSQDIQNTKKRLDPIRAALRELDRLAWQEGKISGRELFSMLVSSSDFCGDPESYYENLLHLIGKALDRPPRKNDVRLAVLGVPPIFDNLPEIMESLGATIADFEVPRQFAMFEKLDYDLAERYAAYTYPYGARARALDIETQVKLRNVHGAIHYVQTFCHRGIEDILIKEMLPVPVLAIEGDRPGPVDGRTETRLAAFVEMLRGRI